MSFDTEACGARIRELRKGNKLTQEKLAEKLNITDSHLRRIESGTRTGSIDLLIDIAAYFEVSMDYLLLGKVDQSGKARAELREVQKQLKQITAHAVEIRQEPCLTGSVNRASKALKEAVASYYTNFRAVR